MTRRRWPGLLRRLGQAWQLPDRRHCHPGVRPRFGGRGLWLPERSPHDLPKTGRLFIPDSWDDATAGHDPLPAEAVRRRRKQAGIPDQVRHTEKWRQVLEMLNEVRDQWELPDLPVVADAGYGDATGFRLGLAEGGLAYTVAVKGTTTAYPGHSRPGRPP